MGSRDHISSAETTSYKNSNEHTRIRITETSNKTLYISLGVGLAVGFIVVLLVVSIVILFGRRYRKTTTSSPAPKNVFNEKNISKDFGFLVNATTSCSDSGTSGGIYSGSSSNGSAGMMLGNSNTIDMLVDTNMVSVEGEEGHYTTTLTSSSGLMVLCDDPRLPLVPSRSWSELKVNGNNHSIPKNSFSHKNIAGTSLLSKLQQTSTDGLKHNGKHLQSSDSSRFYTNTAGRLQQNENSVLSQQCFKTAKSINSISGYSNTISHYSTINKSASNILDNEKNKNKFDSRTFSSETKNMSNGSRTYCVKPYGNFRHLFNTKNDEEEIVYSSPAPNFPTEPAKFTSFPPHVPPINSSLPPTPPPPFLRSSSDSPTSSSSTRLPPNSSSSPTAPEYSYPVEFDDLPSPKSSIYSSITTPDSSSPHSLPTRFITPPPPLPFSPPHSKRRVVASGLNS